MREFNYLKLMELSLPVNIYHTIAKIHEYKGKQELYVKNYPDVLEKMIDVAKIQSTKSSNAIEGIYTNDARLNELMNKKAEPRNRNEEEITGYRHVLDIIHENYAYIEFNKNDILTLHNQLYSYSYVNYKGKFKTLDNTIMEVDALGNRKVRFQPVSSFETENYFEKMVEAYNKAVKENIPTLILIPVLIHDFLCIHPFDDGNGRMSRLLTLLLLYKFGYFVGRYISIEMLIEESKESYYEDLQRSSEKWYTGENDEIPFIRYTLGVLLKAYEECDDRFNLIGNEKLTSTERVLSVVQKSLDPLSKKDIMILCPDISQRTIERALKELNDNNKIKQIGSGRSTKYVKI
ncbi:Fic family protein [Lachnoanaerobaculum gingivalis]|uniref:Fic family protein n=1 Tax=Lachnoanaerobaculum gingivalis TaxID=2490855 RepID=UPI0024A6477C|nr:Fic family protein [Lachnoanaerobaculum gingivalis]WHE86470.1 Fic family protein [Lachnoanaerobaculum gingivalis]